MAQAMLEQKKKEEKRQKEAYVQARNVLKEGNPADALRYLLENLPRDQKKFNAEKNMKSIMDRLWDDLKDYYESSLCQKLDIYWALLEYEGSTPFPYLSEHNPQHGLFPPGYEGETTEEKKRRTRDSPMWPNTKFGNPLHTWVHEFCYGAGSEELYDNDTLRRLLQGIQDKPSSPETPDKPPPKKRKPNVSPPKKTRSSSKTPPNIEGEITVERVEEWLEAFPKGQKNKLGKLYTVFGVRKGKEEDLLQKFKRTPSLHPDKYEHDKVLQGLVTNLYTEIMGE